MLRIGYHIRRQMLLPGKEFLPINGNISGCFDAKAYFAPVDIHHCDANLIANVYLFAEFSAEHQHIATSVKQGAVSKKMYPKKEQPSGIMGVELKTVSEKCCHFRNNRSPRKNRGQAPGGRPFFPFGILWLRAGQWVGSLGRKIFFGLGAGYTVWNPTILFI